MFRSAVHPTLALAATLVIGACANSKPPAESPDGLALVPNSDFTEVYAKRGVTLTGYDKVGIVDCEVSFRKNWLRDQNSNRVTLNNRVTEDDVDRIEDTLGSECDKYFQAALLEPPPYEIVEEFGDNDSVLVLRPSIVDLDVSAPDTMSAGINRTYTTEAGRMTLVLEGFDGHTGDVLFRAIDRRRATDYGGSLQWSNGVTNKAEADRILKAWGKKLRKGLDTAIRP